MDRNKTWRWTDQLVHNDDLIRSSGLAYSFDGVNTFEAPLKTMYFSVSSRRIIPQRVISLRTEKLRCPKDSWMVRRRNCLRLVARILGSSTISWGVQGRQKLEEWGVDLIGAKFPLLGNSLVISCDDSLVLQDDKSRILYGDSLVFHSGSDIDGGADEGE